jgi:TFIIF-interacting CTD phosphatase-like protein
MAKVENKVTKKLKKEDKKMVKKQMKETKKQVRLGKRAAKLFGKFFRVASKLKEVGIETMTEKVTKKNKVKFTVTPISKGTKIAKAKDKKKTT